MHGTVQSVCCLGPAALLQRGLTDLNKAHNAPAAPLPYHTTMTVAISTCQGSRSSCSSSPLQPAVAPLHVSFKSLARGGPDHSANPQGPTPGAWMPVGYPTLRSAASSACERAWAVENVRVKVWRDQRPLTEDRGMSRPRTRARVHRDDMTPLYLALPTEQQVHAVCEGCVRTSRG